MKQPAARLNPFRQLQWRLTLSYTLVTVAALLVVEMLLLLALMLLLSSDFLAREIVQAIAEGVAPQAQKYLQPSPPDLEGLGSWLVSTTGVRTDGEGGFTRLTRGLSIEFDESREYFVLDADQRLLAQLPGSRQPAAVGQPFDTTQVPGLAALVPVALAGEEEIEQLYTSLPDGTLVMAVPIKDRSGGILGIFAMSILLPGLNLETLQPIAIAIVYSVIPFTLAAGLIGTVFGYLTARGLSRRLGALAQAADSWSQGDFSTIAADRSADELGQLARRLNAMAEQLQNLLQTRQELAALEERNRLARDLHDSVKQQLFATAMQVGAANAALASDPDAAREHLANAEQLARQSQQELSGLIQELRPAALDNQGLVAALRTYAGDWSRQTGIEAQVRAQGERPLPLSTEQTLFRIVQEALSNTARHSNARAVVIHLAWEEEVLVLSVEDDGTGFAPQESAGRGFGLRSMRDRVEGLGGQFQIQSEAGQGTRISLRLMGEGEGGTEDEPG